MSNGKPAQRGMLLHDDDFTIVAKYPAECAGLVQYYLRAQDVFRLGRLHWVMETSLLKTLAGKHRSTVTAMARKDKATVDTPAGPRKCRQVVIERDRGPAVHFTRRAARGNGLAARPVPRPRPTQPRQRSGTCREDGKRPGRRFNSTRRTRSLGRGPSATAR